MKKNGFTLMELLGVIILLALLMLVVFPNVINSIKSTSDLTEEQVSILIKNAAKLYVTDNLDDYSKDEEYCFPITDLIGTGGLDEEIINSSNNITTDYYVEAQYDDSKNEFLFNISSECE